MSFEDFQLMNDTRFDFPIIRRDFSKIYHQQGANVNDSDKNIDFSFGEINNCYQIGNAYLVFELTLRKDGGNSENDSKDIIRLRSNASGQEATIMTTGG